MDMARPVVHLKICSVGGQLLSTGASSHHFSVTVVTKFCWVLLSIVVVYINAESSLQLFFVLEADVGC